MRTDMMPNGMMPIDVMRTSITSPMLLDRPERIDMYAGPAEAGAFQPVWLAPKRHFFVALGSVLRNRSSSARFAG